MCPLNSYSMYSYLGDTSLVYRASGHSALRRFHHTSMKRNIILLGLIAVLAAGGAGALLVQQVRVARERERAAAAAAQAESAARLVQEQRLTQAERERVRVEKQNAELADLATQLRQSEAKQASNVAALTKQIMPGAPNAEAPASRNAVGEMLQKMMKDPAMKEMLQNQQRAVAKKMYGPMFKELNLPPDQQKQLSDLLLDSQMNTMDDAVNLFSGDGTLKTNAINALTEKQKATTDQIKALLGDEKYAQYQDYRKSMGDRTMLNQFQDEFAGSDTTLTDDQYKQLIQLMKEERTKTPSVFGNDQESDPASLSKLMNAEAQEQQFQWQENFNKRVLDRAATVLTPQQLKEWTEFQAQQVTMQKLSLKMAAEMFKGGK